MDKRRTASASALGKPRSAPSDSIKLSIRNFQGRRCKQFQTILVLVLFFYLIYLSTSVSSNTLMLHEEIIELNTDGETDTQGAAPASLEHSSSPPTPAKDTKSKPEIKQESSAKNPTQEMKPEPVVDAAKEDLKSKETKIDKLVYTAKIVDGDKPTVPIKEAKTPTERANYVRGMMRQAWKGYREYAIGFDYLNPISKSGSNMHTHSIDLTLHDALSTLKIMGLEDEFIDAKNLLSPYIKDHYMYNSDNSFFETTIRSIGGLVSAFDLSGDKVFLKHAVEIADKLIVAFETNTGLPDVRVNFETLRHFSTYMGSGWSNLCEIGSNIMEFTRLSQVTGDKKYEAAARKALDFLDKVIGPKLRVPGLYPIYISVQDKDGQISEREYSLGAMADSFYEYLLKMYVMTGDTQSKRMFDLARPALIKYLYKKSNQGVYYFGQGSLEHPDSNFQHLTCFAAGMFALNVISGNSHTVQEDTEIGANITETCHYMYASSDIGISPDSVYMDSVDLEPRSIYKRSFAHKAIGKRSSPDDEQLHIAKSSLIAARMQAEAMRKETAKDSALANTVESKKEEIPPPVAKPRQKSIKLRANNPPYFQRPEAIEAMFYMWRLTKKELYRDWVWEIVVKIEEHTKRGAGYTGLNNANYDSPSDRQDSFFLAETLKYAYLIYDDDALPLTEWVFNTEAHPFRITKK